MKAIVEEKSRELAIKKEALEKINSKIRALQRTFEEKKKQQEDLAKKIHECEVKLERA
jgi:dynein heavy chain